MNTLAPAPSDFNASNKTIKLGLSGYPYHHQLIKAGREYTRRCKNISRGRTVSQDSVDNNNLKAMVREQEEEALTKYRQSIKGKDFLKLTMYQQLGLTEIGFDVTEAQVKKAYHRVLIEHHPDKTGKTENDPNYLAVQKAFATLTDPKKKRAYDSQCDFDESIPSGSEKIKENTADGSGVSFYKLYGDCFRRNARFSEIMPVPDLGGDDLDMNSVTQFYNFWHKFDSWRDFTHNAEHDVDSAEHRHEKRYLAKKNEAAAKKQKKKEYQRLQNLVDRAMANDPRIRRVKQAEKDKKAAAKKAKEDEIKRKEAEAREAEERVAREAKEAEDKRKEEAKSAKMAREKAKKQLRKAKKLFRELMACARDAGLEKALDIVETEFMCDSLDLEGLQALTTPLGSVEEFQASGLDAVHAKWTELKN